jgi:hypothetical protein
MKLRHFASRVFTVLVILGGVGLDQSARAGSATYDVSFNTSLLTPGPGGLIVFALSPSDAPTPDSTVSVTVSSVNTDGIITAGGVNTTPIGTVSGDLTTGGVSANNTAYSELDQNFSVGSYFDAVVTLSGSEIGAGATGPWSGTTFSLAIYDSINDVESANFTVNPNVDVSGNPIVDGTIAVATSAGVAVPEPSSIVLLGSGLSAFGIWRIRRRPIPK